jgi:hypothetical protein
VSEGSDSQLARHSQWQNTLRSTQRKAIGKKMDVLRAAAPCRKRVYLITGLIGNFID